MRIALVLVLLAACSDAAPLAPDASSDAPDDASAEPAADARFIARDDASADPSADARFHAPDDASADAHDIGPDASAHPPDAALVRPPSLRYWLAGNAADAFAPSPGPALILMGGGRDVDAAYRWAAARIPGGDAIILRASGADGYQDYLFSEIGGFDSVETLLFDDRAQASDPWVLDRIRTAELVYFAGGDQGRYVELWTGTGLPAAVQEAWSRGATIGGTSAGEMILGAQVFSATAGSVTSAGVLADPLSSDVTLVSGMFTFAPLAGVILDSHFAERDRFGRLIVFLLRSQSALAIGVDEATALLVDESGRAEVVGSGAAYAVKPLQAPSPLARPLDGVEVTRMKLRAGDVITLPAAMFTGTTIRVNNGALSPSPY